MFRRVPAALIAAFLTLALAQVSTITNAAAAAATNPPGVVHAGLVPINKGNPHTRSVELASQSTGTTTASTGGQLASGGGAVLTSPRLFISYWGPEWNAGFSTGGYSSRQAQSYLESFFGGVGGSGWLASTSQYCGGVPAGAISCPAGGTVTDPTGQFQGSWVDGSAVPASPLAADIAAAAGRAAQHFGFQTGAVYMVVTPSGKSETGFGTQWCAWHGWTTPTGSSGQVAYAYLPYQPDAGSACGVDYVNSNDAFGHGYFDGLSIVAGHEYGEAITDPFPGGGWADSLGNENADKCAWALSQSANTNLSTGTFAVQPLWSNSASACVLSSPIAAPAPAPAPAPQPPSFNGGAFNPTSPTRVLDTRSGLGGRLGSVGGGQSIDLQIAGQGAVPAGATSVTINVTVTGPSDSSYLTVWPAGAPRPNASNLNFVAGQTVANLVQVPLGAGGALSIFNAAGSVDVIADLNGYTAAAGSSYSALVPQRLLDTRISAQTLGAQQSLTLSLPVPAGAVAAVLNVTATNASSGGYLTTWPSDRSRPTTSNLNFSAGQTLPNRVVVQLSAAGGVSIFNFSGSTDVVVDLSGFYGSAAATTSGAAPTFTGVTPLRVLDTRITHQPLGQAGLLSLGVSGGATTVPGTAKAVVLNVTATDTSAAGYLTVWPDGNARPTASDLNWAAGRTVPNLVIVSVGAGGLVDFFNAMGSADLVVDLLGYYS